MYVVKASHQAAFSCICILDDFFVGIGDINSAFLPKLEPLTPLLPTPTPSPSQDTVDESTPSDNPSTEEASDTPDTTDITSPTPSATPPPDSPTPSLSMSATSSSESVLTDDIDKNIILKQNTAALEAQVEDRPLARKQEELEGQNEAQQTNGNGAVSATNGSPSPQPATPQEKVVRKALLTNNDSELQRVQKVRSRFVEIVLACSLAPA